MLQVVMRVRAPYRDRWPTKEEFMRDVMGSALLVGACCLTVGCGLGVTAALMAAGTPGAWKAVASALFLAGILAGGCRFVAAAFYEQEVRPRAEANERMHGPVGALPAGRR